MEKIVKSHRSIGLGKKNNFVNKGFGGKAYSLDYNDPNDKSNINQLEDNGVIYFADAAPKVKITSAIREVARGAKFTNGELARFKREKTKQQDINKIAEMLPMRVQMQKDLKAAGFPVPVDIQDLTMGYYTNIVKPSPNGKMLSGLEGNPILFKMRATNKAMKNSFSHADDDSEDDTNDDDSGADDSQSDDQSHPQAAQIADSISQYTSAIISGAGAVSNAAQLLTAGNTQQYLAAQATSKTPVVKSSSVGFSIGSTTSMLMIAAAVIIVIVIIANR
jgi:hypothetical protein